ncbi:MAG: hypothetical protein Q8N47_03895 [Bryobacterales bacterium]|nr:hypothetical protein [Bryobacterales bacterium]
MIALLTIVPTLAATRLTPSYAVAKDWREFYRVGIRSRRAT